MQVKIKIIETLEKYVDVEAENVNEALQKADNLYRMADSKFILAADNFTNVKFQVINNENN